ncbi:MAG: FtsX-like permease family protein, partial [Candidatus Hodarchaeales archaeon]
MRIFFQKVFLDILHARTRFAVIFFGLLLSSVTVVSLASLSSSLNYTTVTQNDDLKLADISFSVCDKNNSELGISPDIVDSLMELDLLESVSVTYRSSVSIEGIDSNGNWTRNCYLQNLWENDTADNLPEVDSVRIVEGRFFNRTNEQGIIISEYLWDAIRKDHPGSIEINKNISIILLGKEISVPIIGVAYNPRLWQNCFIPTGLMHELDNNTELINSISIRLTSVLEEVNLTQQINLITSIIESKAQILNFRIQPRNESLTPQVPRGVAKLAGIIGIGTLIIGLVLTYYIMTTNINDQRKEIAIMRSAGATRKHITLFYSLQALIIGIVAWITGIIIGIPISITGLQLLSETERL